MDWLKYLAPLMLVACQGQPGAMESPTAIAPRVGANAGAGAGEARLVIPPRFSREFFAGQVDGALEVETAGSAAETYESKTRFELGEPEGPAPGPDALADFRDHPGCASFADLGDVALCFRVQPDVSSLELSEKKMWPVGLEQFLRDRAPCNGPLSAPKLVAAARDERSIRAEYQATGLPGGACEGQTVTVRYTLTES
jgi:hypothetical protein